MPLEPTDLEPSPINVAGGDVELAGDLTLPPGADGIVLFAHGSGSSRLSSRNRFVAHQLASAGLATLLFDLLTPAEEQEDRWTGAPRFDIGLLAQRLGRATDFVRNHSDTHRLFVGYFGASTGAAAALVAAARNPDAVAAVVSRGGRPDLAEEAIESVSAPTLLIVGGADHPVLELNARVHDRLRCEKRLEVITGATHLFEEPGALEEVARLARDWFVRFLVQRVGARPLLEPSSHPAP
jgi:dienelactone hydrolase